MTHRQRFLLIAETIAFGLLLLIATALGRLPVPPHLTSPAA